MKKDINYNWHERLIRQVKESILSNYYDIISNDEYEYNKELSALSLRSDEIEYDICASDLVMKPKYKSKCTEYIVLDICDLGDSTISYENFYSHDKKIIYRCMALNKNNFTNAFMELMRNCIDVDSIVIKYLQLVRETPFPYPSYKNDELINFLNLLKEYIKSKDVKIPKSDIIIKNFNPSIYSTSVNGSITAVDAWNNDDIMIKCIINRLMYKKNITQDILRDGLNISKLAPKPSIITTAQAIDLFQEYVSPELMIMDDTPGFSGKLIASILLHRSYSCNPNNTIKDQSDLIKWIGINCKDDVGSINNFGNIYIPIECVLDYVKNHSVFISEIYLHDKNIIKSTDDYIDHCLSIYPNHQRYIFLVKDTKKYKNYIVKIDKKHTHLYDYTNKIVIIDK